MDPVSLTAISIGATALGGATSAMGALQGGKAQQSMYNYRAAVADINRQIAEQNADYAIRVGETKAQQVGMEGRFKVGQHVVRAGASGIDINKGSKSRVIESVHSIAQHDQEVVRSDAAKRAYDYRVQAMEHTSQGTLFRAAGQNARDASKIQAISSLLGSASSVSSKWSDAHTRGIFK